jgi:DNA-binding NarL/FixJ family response regulator
MRQRLQGQHHLEGLTVAISGRHDLYVASLAALLSSLGADVRILGEPATLAAASLDERVEVVLLESPLASELGSLTEGPPVIVLAERAAAESISASGGPSPSATLDKNASIGELSLAIREALEGRPADTLADLTLRQREVVTLLAEGLDNAEIAERLGISERTARAHVSDVLRRLGVANRTQAAVAAVRSGWLEQVGDMRMGAGRKRA